MPIYEYACQRCDHRLDALQKISDDPLKECPECGEASLKKLLSAPRFRLKGDGWYETDFKKDNQRNLAKGDGDKSGDKGGQKNDDKPAKTASGKKDKTSSSKASAKAPKAASKSSDAS